MASRGIGHLYRSARLGHLHVHGYLKKNCIKNSLQKSMLGPAREALERVALNATHEV